LSSRQVTGEWNRFALSMFLSISHPFILLRVVLATAYRDSFLPFVEISEAQTLQFYLPPPEVLVAD
jgi:hypothetical protein